jgi:Ca2+-binding EF-hand superfamily protein
VRVVVACESGTKHSPTMSGRPTRGGRKYTRAGSAAAKSQPSAASAEASNGAATQSTFHVGDIVQFTDGYGAHDNAKIIKVDGNAYTCEYTDETEMICKGTAYGTEKLKLIKAFTSSSEAVTNETTDAKDDLDEQVQGTAQSAKAGSADNIAAETNAAIGIVEDAKPKRKKSKPAKKFKSGQKIEKPTVAEDKKKRGKAEHVKPNKKEDVQTIQRADEVESDSRDHANDGGVEEADSQESTEETGAVVDDERASESRDSDERGDGSQSGDDAVVTPISEEATDDGRTNEHVSDTADEGGPVDDRQLSSEEETGSLGSQEEPVAVAANIEGTAATRALDLSSDQQGSPPALDTTLAQILEHRAQKMNAVKLPSVNLRRDAVYEEAWKFFNGEGSSVLKRSKFIERLQKFKSGGTFPFATLERCNLVCDDLMPPGTPQKLTQADFRAYGNVSRLNNELAVFRFRALMAEKCRTAKGKIDFARAFLFLDPTNTGTCTYELCEKALRGPMGDPSMSRYDILAIVRAVCGMEDDGMGPLSFDVSMFESFVKHSEFNGEGIESKLRLLMDSADSFLAFDKDASGYLDLSELTDAMKKVVPTVSDAEVQSLFNKLDVNGDGRLTPEEILNFVRSGAFFVHVMSPTGFFHIKTEQTLTWGEFRKKILQKLFWNSRDSTGAARIKLDTVKLYKHFGRIGPVNAEEKVDDPVIKHIRAGDFLFVLDPADLCKPDKDGWVENFRYKKVRKRGTVPKLSAGVQKKIKKVAQDLFNALWTAKPPSTATSPRAANNYSPRSVPVSPRKEASSPRAPSVAAEASSSDVSSDSDDDAGAISDATELGSDEEEDESVQACTQECPSTRTAVMLPPALRPLPPPDAASAIEFQNIRNEYTVVRGKLLAAVGGKEYKFSKWLDVFAKMCQKEEKRTHRRSKGILEKFHLLSVFQEGLGRAKGHKMKGALTPEELNTLVETLRAGRVHNAGDTAEDIVSWVELVDMLRLPILDPDVTLWGRKDVQAWIARCLVLPDAARYFKHCDGMELLKIPILESARKTIRLKTRTPGQKSSYIEDTYKITSAMQRKKLLLEVQALLAIRRHQRRKAGDGFQVEHWKKIDILDWVYHDVKLPQYADAFANSPVDGLLLLSLTPALLRSEFGVLQARHRHRIMGQIEALQHGPALSTLPASMLGTMDDSAHDADGSDEPDPVALKGVQAKQLMDQLRHDVESELRGFRRGTQLVNATNFDIDAKPWEAGTHEPVSPKLTGAEMPEIVAQGFMVDAGEKGNNVVLPRQAPVEEMVSVLRIRMKAMFKGGPNEAAGKMWDAMVGEIKDLDDEAEGIEFSVFPRAMKDSIAVEVRSQLQAATLFRFLDMDNDKIISKQDMCRALARGLELEKDCAEESGVVGTSVEPGGQVGSSGHGQTMRHIIADKFLTAMCESMDRQQMTVRMAFTALVSRTIKGRRDAKDAQKFGGLTISSREFVAFVRGMCPKALDDDDANSVLLYIDRDADDKIGWDEFMESFVSAFGRWLMRLKQTTARLSDKITMPGIKERHAAAVQEIHNVQRMMASAFRQTKSTMKAQESAALSTARTSKEDMLGSRLEKSDFDQDQMREYIDRMSYIRRAKSRQLQGLETEFYTQDGTLVDAENVLSGTVRNSVDTEIAEMMDHSKLIVARAEGNVELTTMFEFLVAIQGDIEALDAQSVSIKVAASPSKTRKPATPPPAYS